MKKLMLAMMMAVCALVLAGCSGSQADENKTPEQIKQEVAKMDTAQIQATIENYKKAIADKTAQLEKKKEELAKIPPADLLTGGDKVKAIKEETEKLTTSIDKLQKNMAAYAEGLKK